MKVAKFTDNATVEVGTSKSETVRFHLVTGHTALGGGTLTVEAEESEGIWQNQTLTPVAGISNQVTATLGVGVKYRVVLSGATAPDLWVGVVGT